MQLYDKVMENIIFLQFTDIMKIIRRQMITIDIWDPEKKRLIRWLTMVPDETYIIPQILIVDSDTTNWVIDEKSGGCVNFLDRALLDSFLDAEEQPEEILEKCRAMDAGYVYDDTPEIKTEKDIKNLEWVSGGFHDAHIAKEELQEDGTLYLRFDGIWCILR